MARKDALLRLHQRLIAQRDTLRNKLGHEAEEGLSVADGAGTSDLADVANDDAEREVNLQLVALESRELVKIQKAIDAIREGRYGTCEGCGRAIPIARLQALPYTTCCVECQRTTELHARIGSFEADWESACEFQARQNDHELTLDDLDIDVEV